MDLQLSIYIVVLVYGATSLPNSMFDFYDFDYYDYPDEENEPEPNIQITFLKNGAEKLLQDLISKGGSLNKDGNNFDVPKYQNKQNNANKLDFLMKHVKNLYMLVQQLYKGRENDARLEKIRALNAFNAMATRTENKKDSRKKKRHEKKKAKQEKKYTEGFAWSYYFG